MLINQNEKKNFENKIMCKRYRKSACGRAEYSISTKDIDMQELN